MNEKSFYKKFIVSISKADEKDKSIFNIYTREDTSQPRVTYKGTLKDFKNSLQSLYGVGGK